ncbi:MAG TPA: hypothetical protein VI895_14405, partial [Bdellovibrionota bacterium]|nr:hypothetical protein [Bdellovibrionota bacterium]
GLIDDRRPMLPYIKLAGQIAAACLLILFGIHVAFTGNPLFYVPLTIAWVVAITNGFNLLDNMDGLAGGIAVIAAVFFGLLAGQIEGGISPTAVAIFAGSVLGFLVFNLHPARIFMGDCGSQWIGFTLAAFTIADTWQSASNLVLMLATPALLLAVPIFDTTLVALNRKLHGRPVSRGGRDHASHRLVALGLTERKTVWILWGLAILFGSTALFAHEYDVFSWVLLAGGLFIFVVTLGIFLTDAKIYDKAAAPKERRQIPRLEIMYKRRIVEIVLDTVLIGGSYNLAYLLRYDWNLDSYFLQQLARSLPLVVATKLIIFLATGLYRGLWTYIDFDQFSRMLKSNLLASVGTILVILGFYRFEGFSRTVFVIDFILLLVAMGGTRALLRGLRESVFAFPESGVRILVIGGGEACRFLLHEVRRNRQWNLRPVAILDDDRRKHGKSILGIPIVGSQEEMPRILAEKKVDQIVIAIPSAKPSERSAIEQRCALTGLPHVTMQSLEETLIHQMSQR